MRAWTDYPLAGLGDAPGKLAPIRLVNVFSYDGDKYCEIECAGSLDLVKRCYLYKQRGRCGKARPLSTRQLKKLPATNYLAEQNTHAWQRRMHGFVCVKCRAYVDALDTEIARSACPLTHATEGSSR